ncbi:MAG: VanZ family protein [Acidimicrobiia bacterium]|nr:VanZ family protein [Acidimicrobiia bacterium]
MAIFTSRRERKLWGWALVVVVTIYSTLGLTGPAAEWLRSEGLIGVAFGAGALLVLIAAAALGAGARFGTAEVGVILGVVAVYLLAFVRLGTPEERTHLIEYGVVAVLAYSALAERNRQTGRVPVPAVVALGIAAVLGIVDEGIQGVMPSRVFDIRDIGFNVLAAVLALGATLSFARARTART